MAEIEKLELLMIKRKLRIDLLEEQVNDKKDEMFIIIESEYEEDKKNVFLSNADKRKIEAKNRLKADVEYINLVNTLYDLKEIQMVDEVRLRALRRQFIRDYCQNNLGV